MAISDQLFTIFESPVAKLLIFYEINLQKNLIFRNNDQILKVVNQLNHLSKINHQFFNFNILIQFFMKNCFFFFFSSNHFCGSLIFSFQKHSLWKQSFIENNFLVAHDAIIMIKIIHVYIIFFSDFHI